MPAEAVLMDGVCWAGIGGIALALAGADVTLTDLPHVLPLMQRNVDMNCAPSQHRTRVRSCAACS